MNPYQRKDQIQEQHFEPMRRPRTGALFISCLFVLGVLLLTLGAIMFHAQADASVVDLIDAVVSTPQSRGTAPDAPPTPTAPSESVLPPGGVDAPESADPENREEGTGDVPPDTTDESVPSEALPAEPAEPEVDALPTRIVAPAIELDAQVVPVDPEDVERNGRTVRTWPVASYAAGWHSDSSRPGQGGNIVIAGHNNILGEVFRYLSDLKAGDEVILFSGDRPFHYVVEDRFIVPEKGAPTEVRQENARWIGAFPDERVTLLSCWPHWSNTHRVIVVARPVREPG
jgi:sortase A